MKQRLFFGGGMVLLAILVTIIVWQVSFSFGEYRPSSPEQTYALWAASLMVFLLTVFLGFMLARNAIKLYIERQSNREGSRIKTKLVFGAVALTLLPAIFLFLFSYAILNRNLDKWFAAPADGVKRNLVDVGRGFENEIRERAAALANWIAVMPETRAAAEGELDSFAHFAKTCRESRIEQLTLAVKSGDRIELCAPKNGVPRETPQAYSATSVVRDGDRALGTLVVRASAPVDLAAKQAEIDNYVKQYDQLSANRRYFRNVYLMVLLLITTFVLFVSTWVAMFLARQISIPISALLGAADEVRRGNLSHRVEVRAIDELATLVRAFNEMTSDLEGSSRELESRRRFTEAILESIPTGVISLSSDGQILLVNRALRGLLPGDRLDRATSIEDLFPPEETAEIRYLMKRAGRTGLAASQIEWKGEQRVLHLAVTVSALSSTTASGHTGRNRVAVDDVEISVVVGVTEREPRDRTRVRLRCRARQQSNRRTQPRSCVERDGDFRQRLEVRGHDVRASVAVDVTDR
ncbi:MAG: HAMP domain-containing protein, partial [Bryobacteraceae bacterium]